MFLKLEIIKKALIVLVVLAFYKSGVFWFMFSSAVILGPISVLINSWPNRKLLGYSIGMQLKDVSVTLLISFVMGVIVYIASALGDLYVKSMMQIHLYLILKLIVLVMVGAVVYGLLARVFKIEAFNEYMNIIKHLARKK